MNKLEVREQILTCTSCELHKSCTAPVPFAGKIPSEYAVMGEAPGREEDEQGSPFVGAAGKLLKQTMTKVGLEPTEFAWMNTASCWPTTDGKGRTPMLGEINACSKNREEQLKTSCARWVILTGNIPLQAYRPDLRIGKIHGQPLVHNDIVFFPVYHPAAILRNRGWAPEFEEDLTAFRTMIQRDSWTWITSRCVSCGVREEEMETMSVDGWGVVTCGSC